MDRLIREGNPPVGQLASPKPQYKKPGVDEYEPVEGQHGAPFAILKDASGNVVSPATEATLEQVRALLSGVATENKLEQARALLEAISTKDFATSSKQDALNTVVEDLKSELALVKAELQAIKANQLSGDQKVQLSGTIAEDILSKVDLSNSLLALISHGQTKAVLNSWQQVQHIVRAGLHHQVFQVGDQFMALFDGEPFVWDIIGIDHDKPSDPRFTHSLTIQSHDCLLNAQFDAPEALYYAETSLPAGQHRFTLNNVQYTFTTSQVVPAGGQVFISGWETAGYVPTAITTYAADRTTTIETGLVVTQSAGVDTLFPVNDHRRCRWGSNNYTESAIRQWLNSEDETFVWEPQTPFDRLSTRAPYTGGGFLHHLDPDLVAVLGPVDKQVARNTATDGGGQDIFSDKVFLLSLTEVYGGTEGDTTGESPYAYYAALADSPTTGGLDGRIKYLGSSALAWWLRSPVLATAENPRQVNTDGVVSGTGALTNYAVAPAVVIV